MNNARKKQNEHKQKKHHREQINIRRVIEYEKRKHEETKKRTKGTEKKERINTTRESNSGRVRTRSKHKNKEDPFLFRGVFFLNRNKETKKQDIYTKKTNKGKNEDHA